MRLASVLYGLVSIPLLAALVSQLAATLAHLLAIAALSRSEDDITAAPPPSALSLLALLAAAVCAGAAAFSALYGWSLADSVYFVFSTVWFLIIVIIMTYNDTLNVDLHIYYS